MSKIIISNLKRDLEDVVAYLDVVKSAPKIPGYSDPDIGEQLRTSIDSRLDRAEYSFMEESKIKEQEIEEREIEEPAAAIERQPEKYIFKVHLFLQDKYSKWES